MEQSFFEAPLSKAIPHGLVEDMAAENINSLEDFVCYALGGKIQELLIEKLAKTRGQRKFVVPLTRLSLDIGTKRQTEGVSEVSLETPMPAKDVDSLQKRHKSAHGY